MMPALTIMPKAYPQKLLTSADFDEFVTIGISGNIPLLKAEILL